MRCPGCGSDNGYEANFCEGCGARLGGTCPSCATPVRAAQRFCSECGASLAGAVTPAVSAPTGGWPTAATEAPGQFGLRGEGGVLGHERRWVSVLFCDLVAYTSLAADRDPEDVRELLSRYFDLARSIVVRHGGMVQKFIGDAVMAVWGVPSAHEDDAERAVRAALELLDAIPPYGTSAGVELEARVGVASGQAATTETVEEGIVIGDRVNLASRIQTVAAPGACYVDDATRRLAVGAIVFEDAGAHELKGVSGRVSLFHAIRAATRASGRRRVGDLEAPLIGRDAELRTIKDLFHTTVVRRTPHLAVVLGPAGVGKSRLGWEFEKYLEGLVDTVLWHRGHCLSYGEGVTFWALAEMIRQRLSIAEDDQPSLAATKLSEGVGRLVPQSERDYVATRIARLLGVDALEARELRFGREELFAGWRLFFEHLANIAPVVLVVEDAEHADIGLLQFLNHLIDWSRAPIFVLVLARPELAGVHPDFGVGRDRSIVRLDPLDGASIDRLVGALVPGIPAGARGAIAARAEGIALFAVETVRSMIDAGVVAEREGGYRLVGDRAVPSVPESLVGLLGARLDALALPTRRLVGAASVLGTRFSADALTSISGFEPQEVRVALDELRSRDVLTVTADRLSPQSGDYRFTHELLRQVAYDRLPRRERKARHVAVAVHLRSVFANDADEVADIVARHYLDALAAMPHDTDAQRLRADALAFLIRAAHRAQLSGAPARAAESFAEAAGIASVDDAPALLERASAARDDAGEFDLAIGHADAALARYRLVHDARGTARARSLRGWVLQRIGRYGEARVELVDALDVLRREPGEDTVKALHHLAILEIYSGNLGDGAALAREALELGRKLDVGAGELAQLFITMGLAAAYSNDTGEALVNYTTAAELAETAGDLGTLGMARLDLAVVWRRRDPGRAVESVRSAVELARRTGQREILAFAVANLALTLLELGAWDEADAVLTDALEVQHLDHGFVHCFRGWLAGLRGDGEGARHALDPVPTWRTSERVLVQACVAFLEALVALCDGDLETALARAMAVLEERRTLGIGADPPRWAWPLAARVARTSGDGKTLDVLVAMLDAQPAEVLPPLLLAERQLVTAITEAERRSPRAAELLEDSVRLCRAASNPYQLAYALVDAAEAAAALEVDEDHRARPPGTISLPVTLAHARLSEAALLSEAQEIAARLRCPPLAARADSARTRLGGRQGALEDLDKRRGPSIP